LVLRGLLGRCQLFFKIKGSACIKGQNNLGARKEHGSWRRKWLRSEG
jgi:hypothetical protein